MPTSQLEMYVIYERPRDYPDEFVCRRFVIKHEPLAGELVGRGTLEDCRASLPCGLVRLNRDPRDEPQIVESWI